MRNQRQVQIFFPRFSEQDPPEDNPFGLTPVSRFVNPETPARGALEALLANTTEDEERQGFGSLDTSGLSIGVLTISNFQAQVDFFSGGTKQWRGDLAPFIFRDAVEATLRQFPTVQSVTVMVDSDPNFGSLV